VREDVDRAETMIDQLIVYLRSALVASQTESVALSREFAQLRAYLDIMAVRMGPRLSYRLELPAALERSTVPPMLLQPLVENAIKHGLEPKVGHGSIEIVARALPAGIEIRVSDSGLGLPPDADDDPSAPSSRSAPGGYGLQHVRDRLRVVYGPAARLHLERRDPSGINAVVFIPT
jgi:LytS/YehU family sensor histidine kinase